MRQAIWEQHQQSRTETKYNVLLPLLPRLSRFARTAALCCMTVTMTVSGMQISRMEQKAFVQEPPAAVTKAVTTAPVQTTTTTAFAMTAPDTRTDMVFTEPEPKAAEELPAVTTQAVPAVTETITTNQTEAEAVSPVQTTTPMEALDSAQTTPVPMQTTEASILTTNVPIQTTTQAAVQTTTMVQSAAGIETTMNPNQEGTLSEETVTTTVFRGNAVYGSLYDFNYAQWNGVRYKTDYTEVSSEKLDNFEGFSAARRENSEDPYTVMVYSVKGYSMQECIAVQYAGDKDYFYFYAISS